MTDVRGIQENTLSLNIHCPTVLQLRSPHRWGLASMDRGLFLTWPIFITETDNSSKVGLMGLSAPRLHCISAQFIGSCAEQTTTQSNGRPPGVGQDSTVRGEQFHTPAHSAREHTNWPIPASTQGLFKPSRWSRHPPRTFLCHAEWPGSFLRTP
jgi:hypothetical protein